MNVLTLVTCEEIIRAEIIAAAIDDFQNGYLSHFFGVARVVVDDLEEIELRDAEAKMPIDWE